MIAMTKLSMNMKQRKLYSSRYTIINLSCVQNVLWSRKNTWLPNRGDDATEQARDAQGGVEAADTPNTLIHPTLWYTEHFDTANTLIHWSLWYTDHFVVLETSQCCRFSGGWHALPLFRRHTILELNWLNSNTTQPTEHTCLSSGSVYIYYFSMHELYYFPDAQP